MHSQNTNNEWEDLRGMNCCFQFIYIQIINSFLFICIKKDGFVFLPPPHPPSLSMYVCVYERMSAPTFPYVWIHFNQSIWDLWAYNGLNICMRLLYVDNVIRRNFERWFIEKRKKNTKTLQSDFHWKQRWATSLLIHCWIQSIPLCHENWN